MAVTLMLVVKMGAKSAAAVKITNQLYSPSIK
jgi:hypothetical protein